MTPAIELEGITKRFPGVVANDNVNLRVERGEIHAICGENGAGKSTLMKILYGMQPADEGVMRVDGEQVDFSSPTDAIDKNIGMVHQHFMLADQLTVLENVILGVEPPQLGRGIRAMALPILLVGSAIAGALLATMSFDTGVAETDEALVTLARSGVSWILPLVVVALLVAAWWSARNAPKSTSAKPGRVIGLGGFLGGGVAVAILLAVVALLTAGESRARSALRIGLLESWPWGRILLLLAIGGIAFWWYRSRVNFGQAEAHLQQVTEDYGLTIDVHQMVETLEVGERQRVEIIKVLYRGAEILILDEPTAVLVPQEVEALFENMRELRANGATILFIDHKLEEVLEIADSITVLRHGKTVATMKNDGVTAHELAELMVGSELPTPETADSTVTSEIALDVRGLTVLDDDRRAAVENVSLTIHKGEILGIAGVEGNGQGELVDAIIGTADIAEGSIVLHGDDIGSWSVRKRRESGIGYVPEDRHEEGLLLTSPLWENAALGHQTESPYGSRWFIDREGARGQTEAIRQSFDVRTPNIDVAAHALSGGNQQKLIIGRELTAEPSLLVASHPTRGIDVGAQSAVWEQMRQARSNGLATLLISADLDELIGLSDAIVVMFRGRLVARLSPDEVTPRDLGAYMTGAALQNADETGVSS